MKQTSVRVNYLMNALLAVAGVLFPLITFPYASRILLPDGVGKVTMATSFIAYFSMFAELGVPTYGIRACAKVRDNREALTQTVHELLGINLVLTGISYLFLAASLFLIPRLAEERLLYTVISVSVLLNVLGMEWLYKALELYTYITVRSIAFKLVALMAVFLMVRQESDYVVYGAISIFASSASNLLNLINARRHVDLRRPRGCDWKRHLKPVAIFFAMSCAATVYTNLDALMLGFMTTDADVGFYNAAVKVKGILVTVVTSLGVVLLPRSAYYVEHGQMDLFRSMTRKALHFVLVLASGVSLFFLLFAEESILLLSGEAFRDSIMPMRVIMPTVLLIGITNILGIQMLVPLGKEKTVLCSELVGAGVDLILNALLIPSLRATGAAIGTLAAELAVLAVQAYALRQETRGLFRDFRIFRHLLALLAAAAASIWLKGTGLPLLPLLACSAVCFFAVYFLSLLWMKDETVSEGMQFILRKMK